MKQSLLKNFTLSQKALGWKVPHNVSSSTCSSLTALLPVLLTAKPGCSGALTGDFWSSSRVVISQFLWTTLPVLWKSIFPYIWSEFPLLQLVRIACHCLLLLCAEEEESGFIFFVTISWVVNSLSFILQFAFCTVHLYNPSHWLS